MPKKPKFIKLIDIAMGNAVKSFFIKNPGPKNPAEKDRKRGIIPPVKVSWNRISSP